MNKKQEKTMNKKHVLPFVLTAAVVFAVGSSAWGVVPSVPFVYPPETNPNISWVTQFPYQRNIMMDFGVSPVGPVGPIPGAIYGGYDDPVLWNSDFVTMTGDVRWDQTKGAVGIFGGGSGTITFHFDNWPIDRPIKHFYEEFSFNVELIPGSIYQNLVTPTGVIENPDWSNVIAAGGGVYNVQAWYELQPNPPWEEKVFTLSSTTGNIYITQLHIATECVPEPGALALVGLALGALVIARKRSKSGPHSSVR